MWISIFVSPVRNEEWYKQCSEFIYSIYHTVSIMCIFALCNFFDKYINTRILLIASLRNINYFHIFVFEFHFTSLFNYILVNTFLKMLERIGQVFVHLWEICVWNVQGTRYEFSWKIHRLTSVTLIFLRFSRLFDELHQRLTIWYSRSLLYTCVILWCTCSQRCQTVVLADA